MKMGVMFDFRNPEPWRKPYPQFYQSQLDMILRMEQLGFDNCWLTEHHFVEDGYNPATLPVAAAIAAKSMKTGAKKSAALYAHADRITNYYSRADEVLSLAQWYRLFQAQRLGFEGMPDSVPPGHADVYVQHYYNAHKHKWPNTASISHNWHFLDSQFYRDAALVLTGHPAATMPTRAPTNEGNQALIG